MSIVTLNPALPFRKMLAFLFLPGILGTSHCFVFVPVINTVSTYLPLEPFLSITFTLINLKLLILFVRNLDVLVLCSSQLLRSLCFSSS
jgi:hypothetical protein